MQLWESTGACATDRRAVFDAEADRWWSRGELSREAEKLAAALPPGKSLVFCFCRNDIGSLLWYLACLRAGHAVALLDAGLAPESRRHLIGHYSPDCIVSTVGLTEAAGEEQVFSHGQRLWTCKTNSFPPPHPDLALLLSTSGSTGSPKFVRLTARNVQANAASICAGMSIGEDDCAITSLPLHYSYGLSVVNTHLMAGGQLALTAGSLMTESFWSVFRSAGCNSFAGVPYSYQVLRRLDLDRLDVPRLRTLTQAGGKLQNELIAEFHRKISSRGGRFFVMYGQTEATARISILPAGCLPEKLGSAGLAVAGGRLAVDDGELVYSGPNVMMGYATCRDDLGRGDEIHGQLYTGDSACFDAEGFVHITGRRKRDAKLYGLRLNLDEIETMLRAHGPTAVVANGNSLRIFCEYGDHAMFANMRMELAARLKVHHHAFSFERIGQLPLNGNGKVDYQLLGQQ